MKSLLIFLGIVAVTVLVTACGNIDQTVTAISGAAQGYED